MIVYNFRFVTNVRLTVGQLTLFRLMRFRKGIQLAHVGECTTLKETEQCPEDCAQVPEEPVCGSDGNVYR